MIRARAGLLVVPVLLVSGLGTTIQDSACDEGLVDKAYGPHGYALRGDRCEGIYVQQVGGTVLALASLTESFEDYSLASGAPLTVEWTGPAEQGVRLRARGIKHGLFYRMDTVRHPGAQSYSWPSDVLAAQHLSRKDIGVLAWTRRALGGVERDVYVPLRIAQDSAPARAPTYSLVVFPAVTLREVYVTVAMVDSYGHRVRVVQEGTPLDYGSYPAERPVRVRLPNLGEAGIYQVEIGAELASGGAATVSCFIYHARASNSH
jgi:hypothetical protein